MPTRFRPYQPGQLLLLAEDMREWLPERHVAHYVGDLVDDLDLSVFYARYEGDGRRNSPYEPRMLAKVLVYGYATGVFSSRRLARKLEEDVAFRVLAAGNFPSHRTICEFRRRHPGDFKRLFVEVVRQARELGVANFGKLSIDGTKVRANESKRKAMSYVRMVEEESRLAGEIEGLLGRAAEVDAALGGGEPWRRAAVGTAPPGGSADGDPGGEGAWRRRGGRRTTRAVAGRSGSGTRGAGDRINGTTGSRRRRRRATSRIRRARS